MDYYEAFEGPKVMWPHFQREPKFIFDNSNMYCVNKAYILSTDRKALVALLSSNIVWFYLTNVCPAMRGGKWRYEILTIHSLSIPLAYVNSSNEHELETLAYKLTANPYDKQAIREVNHIVATIYGLTTDEQAIIEREIRSLAERRAAAGDNANDDDDE